LDSKLHYEKETVFLVCIIFILLHVKAYAQQDLLEIDLIKLVKEKKMEVYNRKLSVINEPGFNGIKLEEHSDDGIARINSLSFRNEFPIKFKADSYIEIIGTILNITSF